MSPITSKSLIGLPFVEGRVFKNLNAAVIKKEPGTYLLDPDYSNIRDCLKKLFHLSRDGTKEDNDFLFELIIGVVDQIWFVTSPEENEKMVGFMFAKGNKVNNLYVDPKYRRDRIATNLLDFFLDANPNVTSILFETKQKGGRLPEAADGFFKAIKTKQVVHETIGSLLEHVLYDQLWESDNNKDKLTTLKEKSNELNAWARKEGIYLRVDIEGRIVLETDAYTAQQLEILNRLAVIEEEIVKCTK